MKELGLAIISFCRITKSSLMLAYHFWCSRQAHGYSTDAAESYDGPIDGWLLLTFTSFIGYLRSWTQLPPASHSAPAQENIKPPDLIPIATIIPIYPSRS